MQRFRAYAFTALAAVCGAVAVAVPALADAQADAQGDVFVYRGVLKDGRGRKVGDEAGSCVSVVPARGNLGLVHCGFTNQLPGGNLTFGGVYDFNAKRNTIPVLGGTGRYRGARGQMETVAVTGDQYTVTETIRLDR